MRRYSCLFCLLAATIAVAACGGRRSRGGDAVAADEGDTRVEIQYPIEIDVNGDYPERTIVLQDVAEVTYIPFETGKEVLLDNTARFAMSISDSLIVTRDREGTIFIMGRDGRFVSKFNRKGRGPGEYSSITEIAVDFDTGEIYVVDYPLSYKIMVYSMAGEYKRTISVPAPVWVQEMKNYDKDNLLVSTTLAASGRETATGTYSAVGYKKPHTPWYLVSKQTGRFSPLPISVSEYRNGMLTQSISIDERNTQFRTSGYGTNSITGSGDDVVLSDYACDTMYLFRKGELSPYIVPRGAAEDQDAGLIFRSARYSILRVGRLAADVDGGHTQKFLGIDHGNGDVFEVVFRNDDYPEAAYGGMLSSSRQSLPAETAVVGYSALQLTRMHGEGKLTGRLAEIAAGMKEDDNPVLMLVNFKK